jgi:hypothetical protein
MTMAGGDLSSLYHRAFSYAWDARTEATPRNVAQELRVNAGTPGAVTLEMELTVKDLLTDHFHARGLADFETKGRLSMDAESNKLGDEARRRKQQRAQVVNPPVSDEDKKAEVAHRQARFDRHCHEAKDLYDAGYDPARPPKRWRKTGPSSGKCAASEGGASSAGQPPTHMEAMADHVGLF